MAEEKDIQIEDEGEYVDVVTLTDDEGNDLDFEVLGTLEDGGKLYYALAPIEDDNGKLTTFNLDLVRNEQVIIDKMF